MLHNKRLAVLTGLAAGLLGAAAGFAAEATQPVLQGRRVVITDAGAVADGKTINTRSIQKTIDDASTAGGATVVVPAGTFLTGAIYLRPGVNLEIEKDGVLKGSSDIADFPLIRTWIEGHYQQWVPALINAEWLDHLHISGAGTLDGSGKPFYALFRSRIHADKTTTNLSVPRPRMIYLANCSDAHVEGLHLVDSGFWNLHVFHCHDVVIESVDINAPPQSPSTDGIDIDCSQSVTVHGCHIANNDDGIALKGAKGLNAATNTDALPVEHIHIYDCTFERGDSCVTCGSEATAVRDVEVDHCKTVGNGPSAMLRLKLRTDTPQLYEDIRFHDITLAGRGAVIEIAPWNQYADLKGNAPPPHVVRNVSLSNITGTFGSWGAIRPRAQDKVENVTLENIDLQLTKANQVIKPASYLLLKNVKINGKDAATTQP